MKRCLLLWIVVAGCHRSPPSWPVDLTADLRRIEVGRGGAHAVLQRAPDGSWRALEPHRGEGDLRAINALLHALGNPQLTSAARGPAQGPVATTIVLAGKGGTHTVEVERAALGKPVPLVLDGKARFMGSPVELSTKIPGPEDLVAPGLWMAAEHHETQVTVKGPVSYTVRRTGPESWEASLHAHPDADLEDFAGAITGRQIIAFPPPAPLPTFGLDRPACTAELCAGSVCRTFAFGSQTIQGVRHAYATGPELDIAEIRTEVLDLLLRGP